MKKLMLLAAGLVASIAFAGCASTGASSPTAASTAITITADMQSAVALACPKMMPVATGLATPGILTGGALANAQTAQKDFAAVCAANATLNTSNLTELVNTGIPALNAAVQASTLAPRVKTDTRIALDALLLALDVFVVPTPAPSSSASLVVA